MNAIATFRDHPFLHAVIVAMLALPSFAAAAPPGWTNDVMLFVSETSGADLADYQVRVVFDSATLIADGTMQADADDLRFALDAEGTQPLPYWIESGVNTSTTVAWVRLPSIPANWAVLVHMFHGNPAATAESTLDTFGFVDEVQNSSTNQVDGGQPGGVINSQRGFRFRPNEDVLLTHLGKREPTGSDRYITLFDVETQAIIVQDQVAGPAAEYSYKPLAQPIWLVHGKEYLLEMYQGSTDGYYFGSSTQINPRLTYLDMRYCNGCTKDTFPTGFLLEIHYGYPDFLFRTRGQASSEPSIVFGGPGPTRTTLAASLTDATIGTPVTFSASVLALVPHSAGSTFTFSANGDPIAGCTDLPAAGSDTLTASCSVDSLPLGANAVVATWSGDAGNQPSTSDAVIYTATIIPSQTSLVPSQPGSPFGTPVAFTAASDAGTVLGDAPGGTFTFTFDGAPVAACTDLAPATTNPPTVACTTNALPIGLHQIAASWSGDAYHDGSASQVLDFEVSRVATQTLLATGCAPVFGENQALTLHAAIATTFTPLGTVSFEQDGSPLCQGVSIVAGMASCTTDALTTGGQPTATHAFTASFSGDDVNAPSTSAMLGVTVLSDVEAVMHDGFDSTVEGCPTH